MEQRGNRIAALAEQYDGEPWETIVPHIKKFMPYLGQYLLSDGSLVKRVESRVQFFDVGIQVRAQNREPLPVGRYRR